MTMSRAEYQQARMAKKLAMGECRNCKEPAAPGRARCERHLAAAKVTNLRRLKPIPLNICKRCQGSSATPGLCTKCKFTMRSRARRIEIRGAVPYQIGQTPSFDEIDECLEQPREGGA